MTAVVVVAVVLGVIATGLAVALGMLLRQHGRTLLRLDELERQLGVGTCGDGGGSPAVQVGSSVGPLRLADLGGRMISIDDYRGRRVLMVNWNPDCGYCDRIGRDLSGLEDDLREQDVHLLLVSRGSAEANRAHAEALGLSAPILLADDAHPVACFEAVGTPAACLVDGEGRVAEPLAVGSDDVPALARRLSTGKPPRVRLRTERPLSESRIERDGLRAGTPAPVFRMPDVRGRAVALDDFLGRRVLLVFSEPGCGPCRELAPRLAELYEQTREEQLGVIMVGRGDPAENRRYAEEHAFEFPVVVQDGWKLSKRYGIFATPVAFLIDERGVIARDVARGVAEIHSLAGEIAANEEERSSHEARTPV